MSTTRVRKNRCSIVFNRALTACFLVTCIVGVPGAWPEDVPGGDSDDTQPFIGLVEVPDPPLLPDDSCVASALNRSSRVNEDGTFVLSNVPSSQGLFRVRLVCSSEEGVLQGGFSAFFEPIPDGSIDIEVIEIGPIPPTVEELEVTATSTNLNSAGAESQLTVIAALSDGSARDVTVGREGTNYTASNTALGAVDENGLVTAGNLSGTLIVSIVNGGIFTSRRFSVDLDGDTDGDGIPDDYELANELNPGDPSDAPQDFDGDGLSNLEEFNLGTDPNQADTDADGLPDGVEQDIGTDPLRADTDLDGLIDGDEVNFFGTDPLNADTDGGCLSDGIEVLVLGRNPFVPGDDNGDDDGDGLLNCDEVALSTDPANPDTDGDTRLDGQEVLDGTDPLVPNDDPPTVALTAPAPGTTLVEGQTLDVTVDAADDLGVAAVDFLVNGVVFDSRGGFEPLRFLFTVPYETTSVELAARVTDTRAQQASASITLPVVPDTGTTVQGTVVDEDDNPVAGADVEVRLAGLLAEFFDFTAPLSTLPDLTGLTPDFTTQISAVNFRNPDNLLSPDTFGTGFAPDFAARFSGLIRVPVSGFYSFTLGADDGAKLIVDGVEVVEVNGGGGFFEDTGFIDLPAGSLPIEIQYFQSVGDSELRLSSLGPFDFSESVVPPAALDPGVAPPSAASAADGTFSIPGVPGNLGDLRARAEAIVDGNEVSGSSRRVPPVLGGVTDVGEIKVGLAGGLLFVAGLTTDELAEVFDSVSPPALPALEDFTDATDGVIFTGDFLRIGVNAQGSLNFTNVGLRFASAGDGTSFGPDVLFIGTVRDVWGVRFEVAGTPFFGFGGSDFFPNDGNVTVESFQVYQDAELNVARSVTTFGPLEVTTITTLRSSDKAVFVDATLTNTGLEPIEGVLFSRSSDFDVNGIFGNDFDVSETPGGGTLISAGNVGQQFFGLATGESFSVADGQTFAGADPLFFSNRDPDGVNGDFSASFVFSFDVIAPGESVRLSDGSGGAGALLRHPDLDEERQREAQRRNQGLIDD